MKINYLLSDTTKSATTAALKDIIKKAEANPLESFVVIVPETKSIIIEKELLNLSSTGAFINVYVYSFVRLISRLGYVSPEKIVSKEVCVLLLRKIIYDNISKLNCYKKTAKTLGFAEKIYDTIAQLKSSNISVDDLKNNLAFKSMALKAKMQDIILLYEEYEKYLRGGLYDDCDKLNLLKDFAKTSDFLKESEVFVAGFDNITFEMVSVLKEIAKSCKEITFSCVYFNEKRNDKHIQQNDLYLKFKRVADELNYAYIPNFVHSSLSGDFYNIANFVFSSQKKVVEPKNNVEIFKAANKKQEIDYVASNILDLIKQGKRYRDIGVFVCDLESNIKLIEDTFKIYNIPYFINRDHEISEHFFVQFLKLSLEIFTSHLSQDKVLDFVSNPIFNAQDFACYYNYVQEHGINYSEFLLDITDDKISEDDKLKINSTVQKLRDFYTQAKEKLDTSNSFSDYVGAINFALDYFNVADRIAEIANKQKENGYNVDSEISLQIIDKCDKFSKVVLNFMQNTIVPLEEFIGIYFSGFNSTRVKVSPVSIDAVVIQENTDGFYNIKNMFIVDAVDGKFPCKTLDSGIILDSELAEIKNTLGFAVEPLVSDINRRENFRVYEALLEPKEKLYISFSSKTFDGAVNNPSRTVLRLASLFDNKILKNTYNRTNFVSYEHYENKFAKDINKFLNGRLSGQVLNQEYSKIQEHLSAAFKNALENIQAKTPEFKICGADKIYFVNGKTSVSQLEKYFACPYLFFASYGLRLKPNKDAKISSLDIGNIIHRVAELFMKKVAKLVDSSEDAIKIEVSQILDFVLKENNVNLNKNKSVISLLKVECERLCLHLKAEQVNSGFKIKKSEFSFGGENAVNLRTKAGRIISIEGKIDRIDEMSDYVRIIDYKTGDVKSDFNEIFYGKKIQLVSYLSAITKYGNKKIAGLFYLPIHSEYIASEKKLKDMYKFTGFLIDDIEVLKNMDYSLSFDNPESKFIEIAIKTSDKHKNENLFEISRKSPKVLSLSEFEDIKEYTEKLSLNAIEEILEGYIEPSPLSLSESDGLARCSYCEFSGFCGLEKARLKGGRICSAKINPNSFKQEASDE